MQVNTTAVEAAYRAKELLKSRFGAKFFQDSGEFKGAWWHIPSSVDLTELYNLLS